MTALLPLDQIRLDFRSHGAALRWIGRLYCRPKEVEAASKTIGRWWQVAACLRIYLHALPYLVLTCGLGRWIVFGILGLDVDPKVLLAAEGGWLFHGTHLVIGLASGLTFALTLAYVDFCYALAYELAIGLAFGIVGFAAGFAFSFGLAIGLAFGLALGLSGFLTAVLVGGFAFSLAGSLIVGFAIGFLEAIGIGIGIGIGTGIGLFRLYYLPFHLGWLLPPMRPKLYRFHPVAWDAVCLLPFPGLDRLLVSYAEYDQIAGTQEIDRLIDEYPSQRGAALRARAILVARRAAAAHDLSYLDEILASLPAGKAGFLAETLELRRLAHEITALQARLATLDHPFLQEPFAALLVKEIEGFKAQIAGFKPPLSTELRKAATNWLEIARRQLGEARAAASRESTRQVFRAGDPVDREREAFVQRMAILGELERQVTLANGCPGLLIYGRRRMGKSTLLRNLEGFLPPGVLVASVSMQEARAFTSMADLVSLIAGRVGAVLQENEEPPTDLKGLERFLGATQSRLEAVGRRLLLTFDEYENLDAKIGEGVLPVDLLAVIRESIQTHRRLIWAFAGSHAIDELGNAPWASYLVSARTIEVSTFEAAETRLLLTEPLRHSSLWRSAGTEPPRFDPGFWETGGIERIHAEAAGWPHLVQLVAETVVDLANDAGSSTANGPLLERALDRAVIRGNNVFLELLEKESRLPGEWDYLRGFRSVEEQAIPEDEALDRSLRRRLLIVEEGSRYRLRVPLMARWLQQRL